MLHPREYFGSRTWPDPADYRQQLGRLQWLCEGYHSPLFVNDGFFNRDASNFVKPSASAGVDSSGSKSSSGIPVNGAYPGIGVIQHGSQPS
jgi:hypothetical protein